MANYYQNNNVYEMTVPTPTGGSVNVPAGSYVKGDWFAQIPGLTAVTDTNAPVADALVVIKAPETTQFDLDSITMTDDLTLNSGNAIVNYAINGAGTLTLPTAAELTDGCMLIVNNTGNNTVTITAGTDTTSEVSSVTTGKVTTMVYTATIWIALASV